MQPGQDSRGGDAVGGRRPWGCIAGCVGEALALAAGAYVGPRLSPGSIRPDRFDLRGGVLGPIVWAAAFGIGWPVVCLLGFVAWRAVTALDRWQNRIDDENT